MLKTLRIFGLLLTASFLYGQDQFIALKEPNNFVIVAPDQQGGYVFVSANPADRNIGYVPYPAAPAQVLLKENELPSGLKLIQENHGLLSQISRNSFFRYLGSRSLAASGKDLLLLAVDPARTILASGGVQVNYPYPTYKPFGQSLKLLAQFPGPLSFKDKDGVNIAVKFWFSGGVSLNTNGVIFLGSVSGAGISNDGSTDKIFEVSSQETKELFNFKGVTYFRLGCDTKKYLYIPFSSRYTSPPVFTILRIDKDGRQEVLRTGLTIQDEGVACNSGGVVLATGETFEYVSDFPGGSSLFFPGQLTGTTSHRLSEDRTLYFLQEGKVFRIKNQQLQQIDLPPSAGIPVDLLVSYNTPYVVTTGTAGRALYAVLQPRLTSTESPSARAGEDIIVSCADCPQGSLTITGQPVLNGTAIAGGLRFTLPAGISPGQYSAILSIGEARFALTVIVLFPPTPPPEISGVANAASFDLNQPLAPGTIFSLFGKNLGTSEQAKGFPLPRKLGGAKVTICGVDAPLFVNTGPMTRLEGGQLWQINGVVPNATSGQSSCEVVVTTTVNQKSPPTALIAKGIPIKFSDKLEETLAIFTFTGFHPNGSQTQEPIITNQSGQLIAPPGISIPGVDPTLFTQARACEVVTLWPTGGGRTIPPVADGEPAPLELLAWMEKIPVVQIYGMDAEVLFAGLAPGFAGLYQINIRVPCEATPGEQWLWFGRLPNPGKAYKIWIQ